jgi:hypothetical protein
MTSKIKKTLVVERTQPIHFRGEYDQWGQPSANHYNLYVEGGIVYGSILAELTSSSDVSANQLSSSVFFLKGAPESGLEKRQNLWNILSDEELKTLYAEAAEEDQQLAQLGLAHYIEILRQEEDSE